MVSTFGKIAGETGRAHGPTGSDDLYVFFAVDSQHERYDLKKNVVNSQSYVSNFRLDDYPITEDDILSKGDEAWNASLNTVNIGKYNLGWASIGICTHAFYEAINHAAGRRLYGMTVTDFPHVRRMFTDAYVRLIAMKLVRAPRRRLHARGVPRGPALSALQPGREDEGHDARARTSSTSSGT